MKRTIVILLLALVCGWASAQRRTYVSEGFQGGPYYIHDELWDSESESALKVLFYSKTQEAGGVEPWEALLSYWPEEGMTNQLDGTYRYILLKKQMLFGANNYASVKYNYTADKNSVEGARIFGLAARQAGGEWKEVRQISKMTANLGQGILVGMLPEEFQGKADVQICVFYTTPKDNVKYFLYIDDIEFFAYMNNAYGLNFGWSGMPFTANGQLSVDLKVTNAGNVMDSCEISYTLDGGEVKTFPLTFADGFYPDQTVVIENFVPDGWNATAYGKHTLEFWLSKVNGNGVNTPHQTKYLVNIDPAMPAYRFHPVVEHFSASTCGYCAPLNNVMNPVYEALGDTITLVKYQTYFPKPGDPYTTDECYDRLFYYNVGGVPSVVLDGKLLYLNGSYDGIAAYLKDTMLAAAKQKTYFDMWFDTLAVDASQNIHISLKVKAFGGIENVILHTAVMEGTTYGNASTNGETEFHNVLMKMLPDANGKTISLLPDSVYTFDYVYDMTQTHMEEFTDLKAAAFLQTKAGEVLQSVTGKAGSYKEEADVAVLLDYVPTYICAEEVPAGLRLVSAGNTALTSVEIKAKVGAAGTPVVHTYPVSLSWGQSACVLVEGLKATAKDADAVYFTVTKINDSAVDGLTVRHPIYVQPTQYAFIPSLEDFTSSRNAGSAVLNAYVDAFADGVCMVKYPMKGDPYTNTVNTQYAGKVGIVNAPGLALNGCVIDVEADGKLTDEDYFEALLAQTQRNRSIMNMSVQDDVTITGSSYAPRVKAMINFESAADIPCALYALLVESVTEKNEGGNGEKQIKRVVQALFPGENGDQLSVRNGSTYVLNTSALNPKVENYNNLKLVVIVKDSLAKEVLQTAEFPVKNEGVANESVAAYETLSVYPNPASEYVYLKALENATIDVFDMTGVKVFGLNGVSGDYTLDVRGYVPGAYIIKVSEGAKVSTARISVVR